MARVLLAKARDTEHGVDPVTPPLGAMYLAAVLREAGHDVTLYDTGDRYRPDEWARRLRDYAPSIVGISAITAEARVLDAMAHDARKATPDAAIVAGGPHATAYPERCARHPSIDYVVVGEGERTIVELTAHIDRARDEPAGIAGLVYERAGGELVFTAEREAIERIDDLPFPAWDLLDLEFYARRRSMSGMGKRPYMSLFTSRGCPFRCTYCHEVQGKRFRARSPQNVLREMTLLAERHGIRDFEIVDDIFNFDRDRMLDILDRIIASDLGPTLHFPNALRTDLLDGEQIDRLRRAGTHSLCIAVETTSPRLQRLSKKHLRIERVKENIALAVRAGFYTRGFFMLGFPTETYEEARATIDFAVASPLHEALFQVVTPYAGTVLFDEYQELLRARGADPIDVSELRYAQIQVNLSAMPDAALHALQKSAYRRFYLDPGRAARIVRRHPSVHQLFQGVARVVHYTHPFRRRKLMRENAIGAHFHRAGLPTVHGRLVEDVPVPTRATRIARRRRHLPVHAVPRVPVTAPDPAE